MHFSSQRVPIVVVPTSHPLVVTDNRVVSSSDGFMLSSMLPSTPPRAVSQETSVVISSLTPPASSFITPEQRANIPTIRGGLNGSIADILEASGYGTETDFKVDDEIGSVYPSNKVSVNGGGDKGDF